MDRVIELIKRLIDLKFYGKITLSFEAGKITLIRKEETIKVNTETGEKIKIDIPNGMQIEKI